MALAFLLCGAVLSVPLAALRTDHGPGAEDVVSMGRIAPVEAADRTFTERASRAGGRTPAATPAGDRPAPIRLGKATVAGAPMPSIVEQSGFAATTSTTAAPVVKPAASKPKPAAEPQPKPARAKATTSTTRRRNQAASPPPSTTTTTRPQRDVPPPEASPSGNSQDGKATWYKADYHYDDPNICAHRTLPKGTVVQITNVANGKQTTCRVGDRGPYVDETYIIDLSPTTFSRLAPTSQGVANVRIEW